MRKKYLINTFMMATLVFTLTGCGKAENKVTVREPGKTITIVDDTNQEEDKPDLAVEKIDVFDKVKITDWLDEDTVIVSKENESLGKMSLAELSNQYPTSLYLFDINSKEYELLKEQKEVLLDGAILSKDKKYLLYNEYVLGDPAFFVMSIDNKESFAIMGEPIGGAMSAKWADNETVIGAAYSGGVYLADRTGEITLIEELVGEAIFLVEKINNDVYYNTTSNSTLMKLNLITKEKTSLNLEQVYDTIPSPDGKQMLIIQMNGSKSTMLVYDLESGEKVSIAEGVDFNGVSWSPDQRMVAYGIMDDNNTTVRSLYIYDMLTGKPTQIAANTEILGANWSPSGDMLSYTQWDGTEYSSSIIYLK